MASILIMDCTIYPNTAHLCNPSRIETHYVARMEQTTLAALSAFALVSSITPGPNNMMLMRSEEHTSELQSLMRISYAVFCLKKKKKQKKQHNYKRKTKQ